MIDSSVRRRNGSPWSFSAVLFKASSMCRSIWERDHRLKHPNRQRSLPYPAEMLLPVASIVLRSLFSFRLAARWPVLPSLRRPLRPVRDLFSPVSFLRLFRKSARDCWAEIERWSPRGEFNASLARWIEEKNNNELQLRAEELRLEGFSIREMESFECDEWYERDVCRRDAVRRREYFQRSSN